jgi:DNA-binding response OmpR family regulator
MTRILLIEDDAQIRANVRRYLTLNGHEVVEAADGPAGIAAARAACPDLVLCDVMMPGGPDGFAVLQTLRALPETAATPFIFITASAEHEAMARGLELGAADYVVKPFDLATLGAVLAKHLPR